ncbi:MAG: hypothetical protein IJ390_07835 [Lachnospiraceae bacterium]|nr:hypothetical protein [Lachnospiraceae bacterium]
MLKIREDDLEAIDPAAVIAKKSTGYGAEVLVHKDMIPDGFVTEKVSAESIMVAMAK